jgi:hypothetical protein
MVYKTLHRTLKNEQYEPIKNKQWSTKHYTEHWRMSNMNPLKTNNGLQNTAQNTEEWAKRTPLKTNNGLQNTTQNTEERAIRTPLKTNNGQQNTTQKTIQRTTRTKLKMLKTLVFFDTI